MDIIFAPWRYEYVKNAQKHEGCVLCEKAKEDKDKENLIILRGERCFAMLNLFPYTSGHLMVAPYKHAGSIEDIDDETLLEMMVMSKKCMGALRKAFDPDGFNIGINIEHAAGAGITDHIHMHIVPRWEGDSNFMAVCADARVIPLDLEKVWENLKESL
ncbi:MAG: HIT domain-containing protein [Actinomycetota bacterium]|nr:HIT domain-containing protein [Actinomycetota bacterium]